MIESLDTTNSQKSSMNSFAARTFCSLITCSTYKNNKNEPCCPSNSFILLSTSHAMLPNPNFQMSDHKNEPKPLAADMEEKNKKKLKEGSRPSIT